MDDSFEKATFFIVLGREKGNIAFNANVKPNHIPGFFSEMAIAILRYDFT